MLLNFLIYHLPFTILLLPTVYLMPSFLSTFANELHPCSVSPGFYIPVCVNGEILLVIPTNDTVLKLVIFTISRLEQIDRKMMNRTIKTPYFKPSLNHQWRIITCSYKWCFMNITPTDNYTLLVWAKQCKQCVFMNHNLKYNLTVVYLRVSTLSFSMHL